MDALRTTFDMTVDTRRLHFLFDRTDECLDISIARCFCLIQLLANHIIGIVLQILQRQVLQLALQLIETKFMSQRGIEICRLL